MRYYAVIITLILFSFSAFAQKTSKKPTAPTSKFVKVSEPLGSEKDEFDKAVATENALERIAALRKFIANFPESTEKTKAQELIVTARAAIGDEKLRLSDTESGIEFFKLAVKEAPQPVSDKFFSEILLQFPTNLFWRGQQTTALEIARMIEGKAEGNGKQLLGLATFYIGIENAAEAERLAKKVIALDTYLPAAYQTLGLAYRVNFQLEESANAYAKALELDSESIVSKRSLAEMKRAVGKADESIALYREILAKDEADQIAHTGLSLALFDAGKRAEAETEMAKSLAANANNLPLLVGAAYWYAANDNGAKAVELASKAVEIEPRYTWAHIALARGLMQQKRPLEAERTLIMARQYGNFPTLDYELAAARLMAGFYREAADALKQNFTVKNETVQTRLGNRLSKEAVNFIELLDLERRASIFQPQSADNAETAEKLKSLLDFNQKLEATQTDENELARAADEFVKGDDKMKLHRQLFVANRLLQSNKSLPKAFELTQAAVGKTDAALDVPAASAAVLADELYESRTLAITRNQLIVVPEIPRQTLSAVLRGRIEEISGWTLYQQNKPADAVIHLKRAVSVLPEKSAWWNSSMWRLGASLQADGKDQEALDAYIKSYPKDSYDGAKFSVIEALYQKIHGNTDGLGSALGSSKTDSALIVAKGVKSAETAQNTQNSETASPNTDVPAAPQTVPESVPVNRNASQLQSRTRFPKEVPVKIESDKPSEIVSPSVIAAKNEENSIPTAVNLAENKPLSNSEPEKSISPEEKAVVAEKKVEEKAEGKTNITEEKPVVIEEKSTIVEEKAASNEEKPLNRQQNPVIVEEKPTATEEKPLVIEEKADTNTHKRDESENKSAVENSVKTETSASTETESKIEKSPISKNHFPPSPKLNAELKEAVSKAGDAKSNDAKIADVQNNAPKSLFDPIVITVPKRETEKTPSAETSENTNKEQTNQSSPIEKNPDLFLTEKTEIEKNEPKKVPEEETTAKTPVEENKSSAQARPRVIVTENIPVVTTAAIPQCTIEVGQENISLLGGGGSLGILVGYKSGGDLKQLKAVSESPDDIEVTYDTEIGAIAGRGFFVVKSINTVKGSYKVTFEAPCGKKEIFIKVR